MRILVAIVLLVLSQLSYGQHFNPILPGSDMLHSYNGGDYGGGVSIVDMNSDGWDDIILAQNGSAPQFLMNNEGTLESYTFPFSLNGEIKQISWADVDHDGDRDLTVTGINQPIRLFWNLGNLNMLEAQSSVFGNAANMTYGHSWADYDRDGDLDLFVANYDGAYTGYPNSDNLLYRNDGNGAFTEVSFSSGIYVQENYTFMGLWTDFNHDLWPDLFILNDRTNVPNYMFMNLGNGTFADVTELLQLDDYIFSMTATGDDHDNDGDMDYYITNGVSGNVLRQNNGGVYEDVAAETGSITQLFCWSAQWNDFDNDGWQDLHICSTPHINYPGNNKLYKNLGGIYTDVTVDAGFQSDVGWSRGSAIGDINRDGFTDLVVSKSAPSFSTYWVGESNENHWLSIDLNGVESNGEGIGSWVSVFAGNDRYTRYTTCGESYLAQNSFRFQIGMGNHTIADSIIVEWPSGVVDRWYRIPSQQHLLLVEGDSRPAQIQADDWAMCPGDSLIMQLNGWASTLWMNDASTNAIAVLEPTEVSAIVTDQFGNIFHSDTVTVAWYSTNYALVIHQPECANESGGSISIQTQEADPIAWAYLNNALSSTADWSSLPPGEYEMTAESVHGCSWSSSVTLISPTPLQLTWSSDTLTCFGDSTGQIQWTAEPSELLSSVLVIDGVNGSLAAGEYMIEVLDTNGCMQHINAEVIQPEAIQGQIFVLDVRCYGDTTGFVEVLPSGGTGSLTMRVNGVEGLNWTLPAGIHALSIEDELGCVLTEYIEVSQPDPLEFIVESQPDINAEGTGSITILAQGGTPPYQVVWNNTLYTEGYIDSLASGIYTGEISDVNGCSNTWYALVEEAQLVVELESNIRIWPNPAAEDMHVWTEEIGYWRCMDMVGKTVMDGFAWSNAWKLSVGVLREGYYILEFSNGCRIPFVVQR